MSTASTESRLHQLNQLHQLHQLHYPSLNQLHQGFQFTALWQPRSLRPKAPIQLSGHCRRKFSRSSLVDFRGIFIPWNGYEVDLGDIELDLALWRSEMKLPLKSTKEDRENFLRRCPDSWMDALGRSDDQKYPPIISQVRDSFSLQNASYHVFFGERII